MENILDILDTVKNTNILFENLVKEVSDNLNTLDKIIKNSTKQTSYYKPSLFSVLERTISFNNWYRGISFKIDDTRYDVLGVKIVISDKIRLDIATSNNVTLNTQHEYLENLAKLNSYLKTQIALLNLLQ